MTSGGNNFNHFVENQLTKFSARDAGDFIDAAGEREMAPKSGSLPRDAGDLEGLSDVGFQRDSQRWMQPSQFSCDTTVTLHFHTYKHIQIELWRP